MNDAADKNDKFMKGLDRETIRDVLNNYAHGGTVEQCAESAGVDYDMAYQIIGNAISAQKKPE
ncbi:hypothetical protein DS901_15480 [Loktanella sp. D2R18]|uniref:hypothetical protein n=1 Tax=Rhodobacterales TaxID=204455 RepID=UPI000DE86FE4|nr:MULTISPECIES: hypothetical protein [Rhodobacterales]MDO6588632.1 hypothetical protein [Yoonia sp. 1_MG-2023]RBW42119.1 hypothetical protein DS901_15480 [Loktanella sp. D2R18]